LIEKARAMPQEVYYWIGDHLSVFMLVVFAFALFCGFPVAFVLGGIGLAFGFVGYVFEVFNLIQFLSLLPRIWGSVAQNQVLVAIPMFVFMGTLLEKSGVADDLLRCLQVLLRRVPGGLAMSVTLMGTIMAASTGIVGATVVMLTFIALPAMMERNYNKELAVGTIASAGTLGILIPPSIMLVVMGDLLQIPVGTLFTAAIGPGLLLSLVYAIYIFVVSYLFPRWAPPLPEEMGPADRSAMWRMVLKSFLPPSFLIFLVLGSIFFGWATPTEAAGVGCFGALTLAFANGRLNMRVLQDVLESSAVTNGMVFFIFFGATLFSYVLRVLGGDDVMAEILKAAGIETGWEVVTFLMTLVFLLGFFFDWIEICLIVLPIFTPILATLDFSAHLGDSRFFLVWITTLIALNLQTSFLTPPFGVTLFYMKGSVPASITMGHIYRGIIPFVVLQLIALTLAIVFPQIVLWLPISTGFFD
jgi:tripartite ATP-independent transporter DctM subunit